LVQPEPLTPQNGGLHSRHIHLGLGWQACGDGVEGLVFSPGKQFIHCAFTRVVSRQGQAPVVVMRVERMKIPGRGGGAGLGFQPLIHRPGLQPESLRGGRHKLKEARRPGRTSRARIK
jgi:hypothetical protein